ncbi:MAG: hypothetical protein AMXMBFR13_20760 [Phycisphaerae bacterium]
MLVTERTQLRRLVVLVAFAGSAGAAESLLPTFVFEDPVQLSAGGAPMQLSSHAAPRLVDWDADGDVDILVGGGDGHIWLFANSGSTAEAVFDAGTPVLAGGTPIQKGSEYTGACFEDMNGDGLNDLVVAHSISQIGYYSNQGTQVGPVFSSWSSFPGPAGDLVLPAWCGGRIDVGDWDNDGLNDIVAGDFFGFFTLFTNTGTAGAPSFDLPGERFTFNGSPIAWPHNTHPRLFDINQDGRLDLTYGINWGYFGFYPADPQAPGMSFRTHLVARGADGQELNIRDLIQDDTIPNFGDLNHDGVIDIVSGGLNGKIVCMYGIPYTHQLDRITQIMTAHPADLGPALAADEALRAELFGCHWNMRSFLDDFNPGTPTRQTIRDWYHDHIVNFPQYLHKQHLDRSAHPYVPSLAGQVWVNLLESFPDEPGHWQSVADSIGLTGLHRDLLLDHGTLLIENSSADADQLRVVSDYLSLLPPSLWDAERITIDDYLVPSMPIAARTGVNLFGIRVGDGQENSFPGDSAPGFCDVFSIVLAHEINHTVDAHTMYPDPVLSARKQTLIEQASPPDVIFKDHAAGLGVDWEATRQRFAAMGYWSGDEGEWDLAWNDYWQSGPGSVFNENWLRNNLQLMCEAPQEAFATLANQYFTDAEIMLDLSLRRWNRGIPSCINQFLFVADVYSQGNDTTYLYRSDTTGRFTRTAARLHRSPAGFIDRLSVGQQTWGVGLTEDGSVTSIDWYPLSPADFDTDGDVDGQDLLAFDACASGPAMAVRAGCEGKDLDHDGDVDQEDFGVFQRCYAGTDNPGDADCAG